MNNKQNKNKKDSPLKRISKMYDKLTYFDQYGGTVIMFILITLVFFVMWSYSYVMINSKKIKDDWQNQKCSPYVLPFAGMINAPEGTSITDYTSDNFAACMQDIQKGLAGAALEPVTYTMNTLNNGIKEMGDSINAIRGMFDKVRSFFTNIIKEIMGRLMNIMIPLQQIIISMRDMFGKIQGVMTAALYTSLGSFYSLQSLTGAIAEFIINILIALAVVIAILWAVPMTWGAASAMTAVFMSISIPMTIILAFMIEFLKVKPALGIPKIKCFDKNTELPLQNGTMKKIIDIKVGDILFDNNEVTGKIKVTTENSIMYSLHDIIVSDTHIVKYKNKWIPTSHHPYAIRIENYSEPFLYCLNTSNKTIIINNVEFTDWDEIYEDSLKHLMKQFGFNNTNDIHKYLDGGFCKNTIIQLANGEEKQITEIQIGDVLVEGEKVYGLVEINGATIRQQYNIYLGNDLIVKGGPNLTMCNSKNQSNENSNNTKINSKMSKKVSKKVNKLYHLLTDKKTMNANNIQFYDYNYCVDIFFNPI